MNLCDFVVYSKNDLCVVHVPRNQMFIDAMVEKMFEFYVTYYVPLLAKKVFHC